MRSSRRADGKQRATFRAVLHAGLLQVYRAKVECLLETFADPANRVEAQEIIRGLIDAVVLTAADGDLRVELNGELAAVLLIGQERKRSNAPEAGASEALQIMLVAGTGFEPVTFRL